MDISLNLRKEWDMQSYGCLDRQLKNRMRLSIGVAESSYRYAKARNFVGF